MKIKFWEYNVLIQIEGHLTCHCKGLEINLEHLGIFSIQQNSQSQGTFSAVNHLRIVDALAEI